VLFTATKRVFIFKNIIARDKFAFTILPCFTVLKEELQEAACGQ
jgi:hypothetical protein